MSRFSVLQAPSPPADASYTQGWTVDIVSIQGDQEKIEYRDCALITLARASALFERIAQTECNKPRGYGSETKLRYILPTSIAPAAFIRIVEWLYAINEISAHGEIEDPQISTFEGDGLTQYLRLLQAAKLLELKHPYGNQKRLPDMIQAHIKKAFDTKENRFKHITIKDSEIGLIWDMGNGDRTDPFVKLTLALIVDALDLRKDDATRNRYRDDILPRFKALMARNANFESALIDVKNKKDTRKREEDRERRGQPKTPRARDQQQQQQQQRRGNGARNGGRHRGGSGRGRKETGQEPSNSWSENWQSKELTDDEVQALMSRAEVFPVKYKGYTYEDFHGHESEAGSGSGRQVDYWEDDV